MKRALPRRNVGECEVFYWRDRGVGVDFIVRSGGQLTAIEVKSGRTPNARAGLAAFSERRSSLRGNCWWGAGSHCRRPHDGLDGRS